VYPPEFEYVAVGAWEEAVTVLSDLADEDPRVLAGGQSLVPMMNLGLAGPTHVVDLNAIAGGQIRADGDAIVIPALTRHETLARSALAQQSAPLLAEAASLIGNLRVRHRGTIGGSLAHADPSAELPAALLASGGEVVTAGTDGGRAIAADEFFLGFYETALRPAELIREIRVPSATPGSGSAFVEFVRRSGDFAVVGIAADVLLEPASGLCLGATLVACGVGDRPVALHDAASLLLGTEPEAIIDSVAERAAELVDPHGGGGVSASYRRHLVGVLARRALEHALERALEGAAERAREARS